MAKTLPPLQLLRRISLGLFLAIVTVATILHQKIASMPSIDSVCPFGGVETIYKFLAGGDLIRKIMPSNIVMLAAIIILGIVLSRFFCGWICAFGALQGAFGWLGQKIFKRRFVIPQSIDKWLRLVKYPLLAYILYMTWRTGTLVIRPIDPFAAYGHLSAGLKEVWGEFAIGLVILIASLFLSMLYERAFCKYVCPLGAVNAILGRIPLFRIKRVASTCISCAKCDRVCPMNIDVSGPDSVNSAECIACMECVTACPTKRETLKPVIGGRAVKPLTVALLGLALYIGALGIGWMVGQLDFAGPSLSSLAQEGKLKVEDIKGSSTWQSVADSFGVELERLYREAAVDASKVPPETKLKETGGLLGIEFEADTVRFAVAKILGIEYGGETAAASPDPNLTPVPASGQSLSSPPSPTPTESSAKAESVSPAPASVPAKISSTASSPENPAKASTSSSTNPGSATTTSVAPAASSLIVPADFVLEGTMTIKDIAAAIGASESAVISKLELPSSIAIDKPLRDMKDQYGYTMPNLKALIKK